MCIDYCWCYLIILLKFFSRILNFLNILFSADDLPVDDQSDRDFPMADDNDDSNCSLNSTHAILTTLMMSPLDESTRKRRSREQEESQGIIKIYGLTFLQIFVKKY